MKVYKTEAAKVAALIKAELKEKFPQVVFSVKSQSYTGGNSVDVRYTATKTTPRTKDVQALVNKYKAGHFDGMTDSYEYTYKGNGPTVKFLFVQADTQALSQEVLPELLQLRGLTAEEFTNNSLVREKCGEWPDVLMYRFLSENYI